MIAIGVTLLMVIGFLGVEVYLLRTKPHSNETAANPNENTAPPAANPADKPPAPAGDHKSDKPLPAEVAVRPGAAKWEEPRIRVPSAEPAVKMEAPSQPVQALIGGLTMAHLYQTYLNLGLIADGVAKNVYTVEAGNNLLDQLTKVMDTVERQLNQLPTNDQQPDEKSRVEKVRSLLSMFRSEIKEIKAYWDVGDEQYAKNFQKIHKDAWAEIEKLMSGKPQ